MFLILQSTNKRIIPFDLFIIISQK
jgi:hypothetical protein